MVSTNCNETIIDMNVLNKVFNDTLNESSNDIWNCRICWEIQTKNEDPILILGCKCKGSLGRAHMNCLVKWFSQPLLANNIQAQNQAYIKTCEICHFILSPKILRLIHKKSKNYQNPVIEDLQQHEGTTFNPFCNNAFCSDAFFRFLIVLVIVFGIGIVLSIISKSMKKNSH